MVIHGSQALENWSFSPDRFLEVLRILSLCLRNQHPSVLMLFVRTQALEEGTSLEMLPERLRTEIAIHVHLDTLRKVCFSI